MTKLLATSFVTATLLMSAACGGGDEGGDRPTNTEISSSLTNKTSLLGPLPVEGEAAEGEHLHDHSHTATGGCGHASHEHDHHHDHAGCQHAHLHR